MGRVSQSGRQALAIAAIAAVGFMGLAVTGTLPFSGPDPAGATQYCTQYQYNTCGSLVPPLIAFASERDGGGGSEVYVMNSDGSTQTRLFANTGNLDDVPSWSPDGSRIAFASDRDDSTNSDIFEIYVMNVDGNGQTRLTNNTVNDSWPAWSPDGARIAFTSNRDGEAEIYVMNADGSAQTRLTNNAAFDIEPSWSPDGTKIAFASNRDGIYEIYVMNANGSAQTRLTNNTALELNPSWSPDGSKIAFRSYRDSNWEIYVMNANGSGQTRLTNNTAFDIEPSWSPDGSKIAFASGRNGNSEIYVMNADGSAQTRLTNNPAEEYDPSWQRAVSGGGGGGGGGGGSGAADLYLTGSVEPVSAPVGGTLTWRIRVLDDKNYGPATGVYVYIVLPVGVQVVSATTDRGPGCVSSGQGTLRCNLDWLSSDAPYGNIVLVTNVTAAGELVLTATVAYSRADSNPSNNSLTLKANTPPPVVPPTPPTPPPVVVKPVFGAPLTLPKSAVAGKRFVFTLAVKRSDTGAPLTAGRMVANPTVAGKLLKHVESFKAGKARLSFVLPKAAKGKLLKIKIKITTRGAKSTTKIYPYKVN